MSNTTKELHPALQNPDAKPGYQPPRIVTYTSEEILEQVGPALACSVSDSVII